MVGGAVCEGGTLDVKGERDQLLDGSADLLFVEISRSGFGLVSGELGAKKSQGRGYSTSWRDGFFVAHAGQYFSE